MKEPLLYRIVRPLIKYFMIIFYRPKYVGIDNIPKDGRVILAGNHKNNFDSILLISSTKRCIHFLAKDSLYKGIKKIIFKNMGIIPVNRKIHDKSVIPASKSILSKGGVIGIFPEGTFNKTKDVVMPFKIGAVKISHDTDTLIVPFSITGDYKLFKNNLKVVFDKPYKAVNNDLDLENKILMDKVSKLIIDNRSI